ncbi:tetratricopeptide repeat protein [Hymenobacter sp. B81]|uniref:tetratricopeptide repeat-containing sensor histidine kinase n=1 Tax=Hymenobacter sp. B81 TaxID=3344878 RepID=UPI0037DD0794
MGTAGTGWARGHNAKADSLQRLLRVSRPDTTRVELLIQLAWARTDDSPLAAIGYGQQSLRLARQLQHARGECRSLLMLGWAFMRAGDYPTAVHTQLQARQLAERAHFAGGLIHADNAIGYAYAEQGNHHAALRYYYEAKKLAEQKRDDVLLTPILGNIGQAYLMAGQTDSALYYTRLGYAYDLRHRDLHSEIGDLSLLGEVEARRGNLAEARCYYEQSIERAEAMPVSYALCRSHLGLARLANAAGRHDEALRNAQLALQASQRGHYAKGISEASGYLAEVHAARGNTAAAYRFLKAAVATRDTLFSQRKVAQLQALAFGEQMRQQELAEQRLRAAADRRQKVLLLALGLMGMLAGLFYLLLSRRQLRREVEFSRERERLERQRAAAVLEAEENERRRIGSDLHDGIGQLLTAVKLNLHALNHRLHRDLNGQLNGHQILLDNAVEIVDESFREVRSISHNLMPNALLKRGLAQAVRDFLAKLPANNGLHVEVEASGLGPRLNPTVEGVLFRVIQELVQNIVKHARATQLRLQFVQADDELTVVIEDNGRGFDPASLAPEAGIGLRNVQTRLAYLGGHAYFDAAPGRGTTVILEVPIPAVA